MSKLLPSYTIYIPKNPTGKYVGFKEGRKVKNRLKKFTVRNSNSNLELYGVHWPVNVSAVTASFLIGLFHETLKAAESPEQFLTIFQFENFKYWDAVREAYRIVKAMSDDQTVRMLKTGTVPTIA